MKSTFCPRFIQLLAVFALAAGLRLTAADEWVRYEAQPGSKVSIDGTSTIHDWTVESQIIGGHMQFDASFPSDPAKAQVKPDVEVTIPVRSLKSGKKPMDNVMYDAMKLKDHSKIDYRLLELKLKEAPKSPDAPMQFESKGTLTVSGVTRTNTMPVTIVPAGKDKFKVTGTTNLKMTDFGIKPPAPSLGLGLIKTGDDVKITFEWITARSQAKPATK